MLVAEETHRVASGTWVWSLLDWHVAGCAFWESRAFPGAGGGQEEAGAGRCPACEVLSHRFSHVIRSTAWGVS